MIGAVPGYPLEVSKKYTHFLFGLNGLKSRLQRLGMTEFEVGAIARQSIRYHRAAAQDLHPIIGYLHASYAVGLWDMLLALVPRNIIKKVTKKDWTEMRTEMALVHDAHQRELLKKFPEAETRKKVFKMLTTPWEMRGLF